MDESHESIILLPDLLPFDIGLLGPRRTAAEVAQMPHFEFLAYNGLVDLHPGGAVATRKLLALAEPVAGTRVLEMGCGSGATAERLTTLGCVVVAMDSSTGMLAMCSKRRSRDGTEGLQAVRADMSQPLPVRSGAVDLIVSEGALGFVEDKLGVMREARRVIRPDGRMAHLGFYYREHPRPSVLRYMQETLQIKSPTTLADWHDLYRYSGWEVIDEVLVPVTSGLIEPDPLLPKILRAVEEVLNPGDPGAGHIIERRLTKILTAGAFNRRHLNYALWLATPA